MKGSVRNLEIYGKSCWIPSKRESSSSSLQALLCLEIIFQHNGIFSLNNVTKKESFQKNSFLYVSSCKKVVIEPYAYYFGYKFCSKLITLEQMSLRIFKKLWFSSLVF